MAGVVVGVLVLSVVVLDPLEPAGVGDTELCEPELIDPESEGSETWLDCEPVSKVWADCEPDPDDWLDSEPDPED